MTHTFEHSYNMYIGIQMEPNFHSTWSWVHHGF